MKILPRFKILILLPVFILFAGVLENDNNEAPFIRFLNDSWVDSTLNGLSVEEKIGQLIMITANPGLGEAHKNHLTEIIREYKPGGILIMEGQPCQAAGLINSLQEVSEVPLLVATDGETGLGFRLDSTISYPQAQTLGAIADNRLIYEMGADIGRQFKEIGIHVNFAPVADVNTNPQNPVINFRSFGENKNNVANKALAFSSGMQDAGILAVAKHFPGHSDTQTDSHLTLPVLNKTRGEIDTTEAFPFKVLIDNGIGGIMSAHLNVTSFDKEGIPASLSSEVIKNYLRGALGFNGFVITDAMNMRGVSRASGDAEVEALKAGNDMVEFVTYINKTIEAVKQAIADGVITEQEIDTKCRRVLALKRWVGLNNYKKTEIQQLVEKLNKPVYETRRRKLAENSLTVLRNDNALPIDGLDTLRIASVRIGIDSVAPFQKMLGKYTLVENFTIPKEATEEELKKLISSLKSYNLVVAGIHGINRFPGNNYGATSLQANTARRICSAKKSIIVFFGNAYAMNYFEGIENAAGLVMAYEDSPLTQELAAQLVFGAFEASGKLPVTVNEKLGEGLGLPVKSSGRFKYTLPEEVGIHSEKLSRNIDSLVQIGLDSMAYPGCQVLVAKDGKVIFHKCYGFHTYEKKVRVEENNIYDWASITKITGPLPALMKLNSEGKFDLDSPISRYWPDFIGSNKEQIPARDILAHQGRLQAWIPYWQSTVKRNQKLRSRIFKTRPSSRFSYRVGPNLYMNRRYRKTMFDEIRESPLLDKKEYVYSGLCFYLFPSIIENLTGEQYETYLKNTFYHPLGAYTITFNPYKYFPLETIVPTEYDDFFRKELIRGFVHDEGAAMMGGISGNAGLFGTANDLAKLMQMYMQKGFYGGKQYIPEETVNEFTRRQFPENENRRGLGFDKPLIDNVEKELSEAYPAVDASENSFGHSGYTGTFAWADPDNNLLFIFFSNRVHPTRENEKLYGLNLRPAIHQAIYDAIEEGF